MADLPSDAAEDVEHETEAELKACPFCGGQADLTSRQGEDIWTHDIVTWTGVYCGTCDVGFSRPPDAEVDAITLWNTRTAIT